ncbi:MAG: glycine/sarcosine/betaine reductase complex component C subunit beta [Tissierellia bacterium]|nr:glycine/sarcosine/betaine reductase complex component C subunit beta [Tissierellia bacterium]
MFPVIKKAGYVLVNTPEMMQLVGSTYAEEKNHNPDSDFLKNTKSHVRTFEDVVNYLPNQIYIGNEHPDKLNGLKMPFNEADYKNDSVKGEFGEILTEGEFLAIMKYSDEFDLVMLSEEYVEEYKAKVEEKYPEFEHLFSKLKPADISKADELIANHKAIALYDKGKLVGYVRAAHDIDPNLSAHNMLENLAVKASGALSAIALFRQGVDKDSIDYVIECSEEACGDINQRGGGNFAKAVAETAGINNATGSDTRGFCAAPVHALIEASALVKAGVFKNVLVVAGGCIAKLGMNARDHVKKDLPIYEDCLAGFATLITENDGESPILRTDIIGRHTVKTGSSPQAVITSLVADPLHESGLKINDIDKFSPEMQNPDITKPAGAGNVPEANYKMIGALAVKQGEIDRKELKDFIAQKGFTGWAPTQGHIPSAIPYVGHMIKDLTEGELNKVMLVGKGSLFLGRMTNLFDGVSIVVERNSGELETEANNNQTEEVRKVIAEAMKKVATEMLED